MSEVKDPKSLKVLIENRNLLPVGNLNIKVFAEGFKEPEDEWVPCLVDVRPDGTIPEGGVASPTCIERKVPGHRDVWDGYPEDITLGPIIVPACTRLIVDVPASLDWDPEGNHHESPHFGGAEFTDRHGSNWFSDGRVLFEKGSAARLRNQQPPWHVVTIGKDGKVRVGGTGKKISVTEVTQTPSKASDCN
ncbi:hypothetical protein ACFU6S_06330 [Streptomyces sp. NPDC057456]|uniref:hypothetical protein n=1 Tax=Streptomyces sp. NPDC057456 TaxID=3346139 RepID=UPI00369AA3A8